MGKAKTRRKKVPSDLRMVIAANVNALAKKVFKEATNLPMAIRQATADAETERMAKSNVQKVLAGKTSVTLEQLDSLARALEVAPYQLLIPALDPDNPQVAKGATLDERELYKVIAQRAAREAVKEALQQTSPPYKPSKSR